MALALIILWSCALGHLIVGKQTFPTADVSLLPVPYVDSAVQIGDVWTNVVLTLGDMAPPLWPPPTSGRKGQSLHIQGHRDALSG